MSKTEKAKNIKRRIRKQFLYSLTWKAVLMLCLSLWLVRDGNSAVLMAFVTVFIIASEYAVFMNLPLKSIDTGVEEYGDKFVEDAFELLQLRGDMRVYQQLLLTTYDGEGFKSS